MKWGLLVFFLPFCAFATESHILSQEKLVKCITHMKNRTVSHEDIDDAHRFLRMLKDASGNWTVDNSNNFYSPDCDTTGDGILSSKNVSPDHIKKLEQFLNDELKKLQ